MSKQESNPVAKYTALLGLLIAILFIHYGIDRHESTLLLSSYSAAFLAYVYLLRSEITHQMVLGAGILIRLSLFFAIPNLTEDFYRFIWDGTLIQNGIHPFSATPDQIMVSGTQMGQNMELFESLNSKPYFTIYPPVSQFIFWLSAFGKGIFESVTILRSILFAFEIGTMFLLHRYFNSTEKGTRLAIYALNPLVILELTGNLHFEGIMVFFVLVAILAIRKQKWWLTALSMALGIGVKLIPLMFLPALMKKIGLKKSMIIYGVIGCALLFMAWPLLDQHLIMGMSDSLYLFINQFEFNAGLFFLFRETGYLVFGFDIIYIVGPLFSILALGGILWYSFFKVDSTTDLTKTFSVLILIQLSLSTTVHPWYIIPLIALAVSSGYIFPVVWSFLIFFTYMGYSAEGYDHPLMVIGIEYLITGYIAVRELFYHQKFDLIHE